MQTTNRHASQDPRPGKANSRSIKSGLLFQVTMAPLEHIAVWTQLMTSSNSFLNSWYAGDYPSSFENLHQYYDYAMSNKDRSHYQYALLNLAILQADFGCYDEAMAAMEETIATARENKDIPCLNFSLSWLQHFCTFYDGHANSDTPGDGGTRTVAALGAGGRSLGFLKEKAKEFRMWSIVSSSLLNEARMDLVNVSDYLCCCNL